MFRESEANPARLTNFGAIHFPVVPPPFFFVAEISFLRCVISPPGAGIIPLRRGCSYGRPLMSWGRRVIFPVRCESFSVRCASVAAGYVNIPDRRVSADLRHADVPDGRADSPAGCADVPGGRANSAGGRAGFPERVGYAIGRRDPFDPSFSQLSRPIRDLSGSARRKICMTRPKFP
jgi:hypothetical protein